MSLSSEIDSIRPTDTDEYERLRRKDSYGHKKLKIEEYLSQWQSKSNDNWFYVILRLPDVLGPRDSTDRWWFYQMWIQFYSSIQKTLEISTNLRSSYVYVNDVARYITHIFSITFLDSSTIFYNQILNIGCTEIVSINDLLSMIIDELNLNTLHIPIKYNPNTEAGFFPSVTRGGINISKALSDQFNWKPTPLKQVVRETIQWYNDAYEHYPNERSTIVKRIRRTLLNNDENAYGKFLYDVNQYSTQNILKRKREEEKKILIVCLPTSNSLSSEIDSIRPTDTDEYERLRRKDSYGHKKLKIEEYLSQWQSKSNDNWFYVVLRLPDVLGPRDSTDRWWFYQMWIQFYTSIQKTLEISTNLRSSYVYVNDVARYITHILSITFLDSSTIFYNQILNIGCTEIVSINDLLSMIIDELNLNRLHIPIKYNPNTEADFFPSVTRGGINISKALSNQFNWKPTPLKQVVRETIQWYNDAYEHYPNERSAIVKRIRRTLLNNDENAYGKFLYDVNQYSTQNILKRKREEEKKILIVDHGDNQQEKLFKHNDEI
ncbi:unnamed protein product [Adineta steineri]|uniref:NAD-dependent epimerase/dehydratase domain-containing protein n=1 Tax=Adineta steineri TaxID=433720 RepID=A0A813XLI9_9BILA|nr:unnamed protein product [Adineta steineri]